MESDQPHTETYRLKAIVEADPGAVIRVLQHFQARNSVPPRISVQSLGADCLQIEIEVVDLSYESAQRIVSKIRTMPTAIAANLCD